MTTKTPLLLLPGLLCDAALWAHQLRHLAGVADMSVADLTRDETVEAMAARVLSAAPPRFALAGLSMGGYVAFEIMRRAPERIERLCLIATSARADTAEQAQVRRGLIGLAQKGRFKGVTPRLLPTFVHPDRAADPELARTVMDMAEGTGREAFVRQEKAILSRPDSRPDLVRINCPTLVLCGRQDIRTPVEVHEEMAAGIPGARLVIIEDCGHLPPVERPEETTGHMRDWLAGA